VKKTLHGLLTEINVFLQDSTVTVISQYPSPIPHTLLRRLSTCQPLTLWHNRC